MWVVEKQLTILPGSWSSSENKDDVCVPVKRKWWRGTHPPTHTQSEYPVASPWQQVSGSRLRAVQQTLMDFSYLARTGYIYIRAVSVTALIYEINLAAINALKYFNSINATVFTSGVVEVVSLLWVSSRGSPPPSSRLLLHIHWEAEGDVSVTRGGR